MGKRDRPPPTPRARPRQTARVSDGLMMKGAAPVFTPAGRHLGVLYGGVLLNRNSTIVDKIRATVFKEEEYEGRPVGTATIFQDDVRISTNVRNADGTFARNAQGQRIRRPDAGTVGSIEELRLTRQERAFRASRSYDGFYPSVHLTYNVTENFQARAAHALTYGRPAFTQVIPNATISEIFPQILPRFGLFLGADRNPARNGREPVSPVSGLPVVIRVRFSTVESRMKCRKKMHFASKLPR
mgnify:CR=1 FL=1